MLLLLRCNVHVQVLCKDTYDGIQTIIESTRGIQKTCENLKSLHDAMQARSNIVFA